MRGGKVPALKNSRILVTGGAGFVGSFVVEQLLKEGVEEVVVIDNFFRGSRENLQACLKDKRVAVVEGDIRDRALLETRLQGMDYCFHLAALRITHCATEPRQAMEIMYDGTFNVLEGCVKHKIKKVLFASSASIYGQADIFPTPESHHPYNNQTLYGAAKLANELMLRSFYHMYGLSYNAVRYFNVYGPRMDTFGKYTEVFIRWYHAIKEGKEPLIFGEGNQTMDFIYIEEVARASILALKADIGQEVFNIASGVETSLKELCQLLLKTMRSHLNPKHVPIPEDRKKVEVIRRLADVRKAREKIGFESKISLEEGLVQLVQWLDRQERVVAKS